MSLRAGEEGRKARKGGKRETMQSWKLQEASSSPAPLTGEEGEAIERSSESDSPQDVDGFTKVLR